MSFKRFEEIARVYIEGKESPKPSKKYSLKGKVANVVFDENDSKVNDDCISKSKMPIEKNCEAFSIFHSF